MSSRPDPDGQSFDWLYRGDPDETRIRAEPDTVVRPPQARRAADSADEPAAPSPVPPPAGRPSPRPRPSRLPWVLLALLVLALVAALIAVLPLLRGRPAEPAEPAARLSPFSGRVVPAAFSAATADCTAPDVRDEAGRSVSYSAANLIDAREATAWRCDGDAVGQIVALDFAEPTTVAQVGIVNGYAKTDPATGESLYPQYRRVRIALLHLGDGAEVQVHLDPQSTAMQVVRIDPVTVRRLTVTIVETTAPGTGEDARDATAVSEIAAYRPA